MLPSDQHEYSVAGREYGMSDRARSQLCDVDMSTVNSGFAQLNEDYTSRNKDGLFEDSFGDVPNPKDLPALY